MNPHQASELIPIMQAFADGKVVQMWIADHDPGAKVPGVWVDIKDPTFSISENWRVKPEPPREFWVVVGPLGPMEVYKLKPDGVSGEVVHVREVTQ